MSNKNYEDAVVLDDSIAVAEDSQQEKVIGIVTDCIKLNIREKPSKDSSVVAVVNCLDELRINNEDSTSDWYAVCTATGIDGYCMRKFVAVRR